MQFLYTLNHKKCRIYSHFNFLKYHRNTHNVFLTTFVQCKVSNANIYFYNTKQAYKHSKTENYIDVFIILDRRFCFQLSDLALRKPANVYFGVVGCDVPTFTGKECFVSPRTQLYHSRSIIQIPVYTRVHCERTRAYMH